MKRFYLLCGCALLSCSAIAEKTPYGSCSERAQTYQERYEKSMQSKDLVCYQTALKREMSDGKKMNCPKSAQHYQSTYEKTQRSNDLICYQQALQRELR